MVINDSITVAAANARKKIFRSGLSASPSPSPPAARSADPKPHMQPLSDMPSVNNHDDTQGAGSSVQAKAGMLQPPVNNIPEPPPSTVPPQDTQTEVEPPGSPKLNASDSFELAAPISPTATQTVAPTEPSSPSKDSQQPVTAPVLKPSGAPAPTIRTRGGAKKTQDKS